MLLSSRQETAEDQPFFKISSHNKSVNQHQGFFLLPSQSQTAKETGKSTSAVSMFQESTSSVSHQGRQNSPFQIPVSTTAAQCTFQTQQARQRQTQHINPKDKVEEAVTHNPEKLTSLHSRLHQEADKIRRWKVETEIELKQQEQKLRDSLQTVESQRKSLLELQLQNETLSGKLQEEIDGRAELEEKIESTRDMCSLVKDYSVKLEEKLALCEKDRDDIQEVQKKQQEDLLVRIEFKSFKSQILNTD
ncbi:Synaptonemal complex protein 1 [Holothuria leucospilota]|uniref:Synaptonemal complex protein 1 n=1 Tax=Holothuria leucospilota TaxID=206669 RepID=A0A9Q1H425_HOLLE|nr:Synaptonemal complex protein 1 [Holothuria leucospilota]